MKEHVLLLKAIRTLQIDVPVLSYQVQGNQIRLCLYGGRVVEWQEPETGLSAEGSGRGERCSPPTQKVSNPIRRTKKKSRQNSPTGSTGIQP